MTEQLCFPYWIQFIHGLQFTNNNFLDKDIQSQPFIK